MFLPDRLRQRQGSVLFQTLCVPFDAPEPAANLRTRAADPPSADLDQLDLPVLCDGLRRYLLDLPQPVVHPALQVQMVHTAKGGSRDAR